MINNDELVICEGCGNNIDPNICGCGEDINHSAWDFGHTPMPYNCDCGREKSERKQSN